MRSVLIGAGALVFIGGVIFATAMASKPTPPQPKDSVSTTTPPSNTKAGSGVAGIVLLGPACPVERIPPDPACAPKPYETKLVLTTSDQARVLKEFSSDKNGLFRVDAPPGNYAVRSAAAANILPRCASNEVIVVPASEYVQTTISCDTGIR